MDFQQEKRLVLDYYRALDSSDLAEIPHVLERYTSKDWLWRGFHPFDRLIGFRDVGRVFWHPFVSSFAYRQRRQDIFFAGLNQMDDFSSVWVVSLGHLVGLFDASFLGIPSTGKMAFLPYCEFNCVKGGRIISTAFYFDLPHLMCQAGLNPFPSQAGAHLLHPGPAGHDGLCFSALDEADGDKTLSLINSMITTLGRWDSDLSLEDELAQTWASDMIWWGPTGIGSTYTIKRYAQQHSAPFRAAFGDRSATSHLCRLAQGHYGGFFGWPNFTAVNVGGFLGVPASDVPCEFRVIDIYRRAGDKLAENWVFIDLLHWLHQQGIDLLGDLQGQGSDRGRTKAQE